MNEERRNVKINNSEYYVVGKDASRKVEAKVFDGENKVESKNNSMLKLQDSKTGIFGIRQKEHRTLPKIMQDALSQAVEEVEQERIQSEEIDSRIEDIKETYEDSS